MAETAAEKKARRKAEKEEAKRLKEEKLLKEKEDKTESSEEKEEIKKSLSLTELNKLAQKGYNARKYNDKE